MIKAFARKTGLAAGLFISAAAWATTFGPIPVYQQAQNTQYFVHGRVTTGPDVYMENTYQKPFTKWTLDVAEQTQGEPLGSQITIREPGGEIGDFGYHVAGSAEFTVGEDVFVALHDTDEPGVKEVVGLASGKYRVEVKNGKQVVVSGLGLPVTGQDGVALGPEDFTGLLRRIAEGRATAADKDIWVSRRPSHGADEGPVVEARERQVEALAARRPADVAAGATATAVRTDSGKIQPAPNPAAPKENSVQESTPAADEASTGFSSWGWILALAVVASLIFGLYLALKR